MDNEMLLIEGGYILLARRMIDSEIWFKPPLYLKVWVYLLARAQHKDYRSLKKGQLLVSIPALQEACHWYVGCRKMVPTKDQVFQVLEWLRSGCAQGCAHDASSPMVTTVKATRGMVVTIHNYGAYQNPRAYEGNAVARVEVRPGAIGEQQPAAATNKKEKKIKREEKTSGGTMRQYGEFVSLTEAEYGRLTARYGSEGAGRMVEILNNYKGASGRQYRSDYLAIENWVVERYRREQAASPSSSAPPPSGDKAWEEVRAKLVTSRQSPLVWSHPAVAQAVKNTGYKYILDRQEEAAARFAAEYEEVARRCGG
ncbi:MAG: hypothetical protein P4N59_17660 [Negativicutes bacterium]|nr:hypothetical protein [Negativicutes bacterium]